MLMRLPDELLLQIADHIFTGDDDFINENRNPPSPYQALFPPPKSSPVPRTWGYGTRHILELSLVDQRTRAVALELLVPEISVQFCNIPSLVRMYLRYSDLAAKTKILEIKSSSVTSKNFKISHSEQYFVPDEALVEACKIVVWNDVSTDLLDKGIWTHELVRGNMNALLAVLFSLLSNLESLHLQRIDVKQLSFFNCLFEPTWMRGWYRPPHWGSEYLEKVFARQSAKIQDLELPRSWQVYVPNREFPGESRIAIRSLTSFHSLRRLVVLEATLFESIRSFKSECSIFSKKPDPADVLPQTLESLSIFNIDFRTAFWRQDHRVLDFVRTLFIQTWQSQQQTQHQHSTSSPQVQQIQKRYTSPSYLFPSLRYIYIEYERTAAFFDHVLTLEEWARIELTQQEIEEMGKELSVEVEFNFPWVGDPF